MRFDTLIEAQAAARALKSKGFGVSILEAKFQGWIVTAWRE